MARSMYCFPSLIRYDRFAPSMTFGPYGRVVNLRLRQPPLSRSVNDPLANRSLLQKLQSPVPITIIFNQAENPESPHFQVAAFD